MKSPVIGIVPAWDSEKSIYTLSPKYTNWIERSGGTPVILNYPQRGETLQALVNMLDGVVFSGGPDIDPRFFGEQKLECCGQIQPNRDEMERELFRLAVEQMNLPTLGICKGCQVINVMLGGTLYQDIETQCPDAMAHRLEQHENAVRGIDQELFTHTAALAADGPLGHFTGKSEAVVTSYHHQAVKALAPGLAVMATAPDGIIEAFYAPERRFLWGVQFHPEMFGPENELSRVIFAELIKSCV